MAEAEHSSSISPAPHASPSGSTRRVAKRGATNRRLILNAANALLRTKSYESFHVDQLRTITELSRRSLYNHFPSKDDLYRSSREDALKKAVALLPQEVSTELDLQTALSDYMNRLVAFLVSEPHVDLFISVIRDGESNPWLADEYNKLISGPIQRSIELYLFRMQQRQVIHAGMPSGLAQKLVCMGYGHALAIQFSRFLGVQAVDPPEIRALVERLFI